MRGSPTRVPVGPGWFPPRVVSNTAGFVPFYARVRAHLQFRPDPLVIRGIPSTSHCHLGPRLSDRHSQTAARTFGPGRAILPTPTRALVCCARGCVHLQFVVRFVEFIRGIHSACSTNCHLAPACCFGTPQLRMRFLDRTSGEGACNLDL